jgi:lipopolysaccharide heptosyltransferase II
MSLHLPAGARHQVTALLAKLGLEVEQPWVVIHPGASAPSRRYPPEGFAAVARQLVREKGRQVVFTGTEAERDLVKRIQTEADVPTYSLAGRLNLGEMAALVALAPLLIANNTGPAHLAAAVGTPIVDLYALTNPQHMPWGVPSRVLFHNVPCKYCYKSVCPEGHHHCLRLVTPASIVQAALELLDPLPGRTPATEVTL